MSALQIKYVIFLLNNIYQLALPLWRFILQLTWCRTDQWLKVFRMLIGFKSFNTDTKINRISLNSNVEHESSLLTLETVVWQNTPVCRI